MPSVAAISKIDLPHKVEQQEVKEGARKLVTLSYPQIKRMMGVFYNTKTKTQNMYNPLLYCTTLPYIRLQIRMLNTFVFLWNILSRQLKNASLQYK